MDDKTGSRASASCDALEHRRAAVLVAEWRPCVLDSPYLVPILLDGLSFAVILLFMPRQSSLRLTVTLFFLLSSLFLVTFSCVPSSDSLRRSDIKTLLRDVFAKLTCLSTDSFCITPAFMVSPVNFYICSPHRRCHPISPVLVPTIAVLRWLRLRPGNISASSYLGRIIYLF